MAIYCARCESPVEENCVFCPQCGNGLRADAPVPVPPAPSGQPDTMPCPACGKQIVPQWTYLGRTFMGSIGGFGLEGHGKARLCPLCGENIDELQKQREFEERQRVERERLARMTPGQRAAAEIGDRFMLFAVAGGLVLLFMAYLALQG